MGSIEVTGSDGFKALKGYGVNIDVFGNGASWVIDTLSRLFPKQVIKETSENESWKAKAFWSVYQRDPNPAGIFQPISAKEVAIAVLLCKGAQCKFAVKSGGHAPMKNASSVDGGVVFDMKNFNMVKLNEDKSIASLGTGNRWETVFRELDSHGVGVAGGRAGDVGVGGYTVGGGISFFASARGWGCDTVRNFELVTASGEILDVNYQSYPDLYWALRGGGNNFGIVTRFDYETFPQNEVFAGSLLYEHKHKDAAIAAFATYSNHGDPKAATWFCPAYNDGHKLISVLAMYADPHPEAEVLKPYLSIPTIHGGAKVRSMADIVKEVADVNVKEHRQTYTNITFKFDQDFVSWLSDLFWEEIPAIHDNYESKQGYVLTFQVYTKEAVGHMQRNGGNCLGLTVEEAPYLNVLSPCAWIHAEDDKKVKEITDKLFGQMVEEGKRRRLYKEFIYMNYAAPGQDVLKGYGQENYDRLKSIAEKYDPEQVFQKLMPGYFKFGGAPE